MTTTKPPDLPELAKKSSIDPTVLWIAAAVAAVFVILGVVATESLSSITTSVQGWVINSFGWVFVLVSTGFVVLSIYLAVSRYGRIRLGGDDERPEFSTVSWVAMMFSAGMGIGLMFYGAAEPLFHLTAPSKGEGRFIDPTTAPGSTERAQQAMEYSFFHWAFHPWAMYAVVGLALAYFCFRKGKPNLISTAFFPLIGEKSRGGIGKAIDIFAIFATLFGSAVSLGLGALQINSGLTTLWDFPKSDALAIGIILVLTVAFVASAVSGVHRGIQFLSNTNMVLAIVLLAFLFVVGPTVFILNTFSESLGDYLFELVPMSFRAGAFGGQDWLAAWSIFYWAWWISWTPFVGTFIARISRGRTIREFIVGVVLVPSVVSFVWFSVLGGAAIDVQRGGTDLTDGGKAAEDGILYNLLAEYPMFTVTAIVVMILVALFFISGADAASIVMGTLSSRGALEPGKGVTIMWGVLTGLVAAVLLLAGGLPALKTLCIIAAFPFLLIMVGACWGLMKELRKEPLVAELDQHVLAGVLRDSGYAPVKGAGKGNGAKTQTDEEPETSKVEAAPADES
ncbi:MAG: BCCT family transporter [Micromonosporaceae bacterium]